MVPPQVHRGAADKCRMTWVKFYETSFNIFGGSSIFFRIHRMIYSEKKTYEKPTAKVLRPPGTEVSSHRFPPFPRFPRSH